MNENFHKNEKIIKSKLLIWKTNVIKDNINQLLMTPFLNPSNPDISNPSSFDLDCNDNMIVKRCSSLDSNCSLFNY